MDSMKSNMENRLLPVLKEMMLKAEREENYVKALECIRSIFNIDPVDEDAYGLQVKLLKKTGNDLEVMEAQIRYKEAYKKVYGKN
jgi:two-component SAPR family response regulator